MQDRTHFPVTIERPTATGILLIAALLIALAVCALSLEPTPSTGTSLSVPTEYVAISEGDTLWSIAERHPIDGLTTRQCVMWIVAANGMDGSVVFPGQVLEVPGRQAV